MADKDTTRQGPFSRVLQKHAGRAKERILQNFGKADRTTDEDFDVCVKNFNMQQAAVSRLQKEFKNYHQCLKAMQAARKSLMDTVCELYEPCWIGLTKVLAKAEMLNDNYEQFCDTLNNQLLTPVTAYVSQFPELNNKISKRNRKMLDYDNCRHNFQNLDSMKKREEAKITKAKEQLDEAQSLFEVINTELHDELPALYDSRVTFFVSHLQCLFLSEAKFHNEDSLLFTEINSVLESLKVASKRSSGESHVSPAIESGSSEPSVAPLENNDLAPNDKNVAPPVDSTPEVCEDNKEEKDGYSSGSTSGSCVFSTPPTTTARNIGPDITAELGSISLVPEENISDVNAAGDAPAVGYRFLYQVRGTYRYLAEDADELSFNVGDIIEVIAYDDPEEQEEGWLMGMLDNRKGLFPANFTSRI